MIGGIMSDNVKGLSEDANERSEIEGLPPNLKFMLSLPSDSFGLTELELYSAIGYCMQMSSSHSRMRWSSVSECEEWQYEREWS